MHKKGEKYSGAAHPKYLGLRSSSCHRNLAEVKKACFWLQCFGEPLRYFEISSHWETANCIQQLNYKSYS